jgi:hypothetical protein
MTIAVVSVQMFISTASVWRRTPERVGLRRNVGILERWSSHWFVLLDARNNLQGWLQSRRCVRARRDGCD